MIVRVFHFVFDIDPSRHSGQIEGGHKHPEMEKWLQDNGSVKIEHMVQSQSYEPPTPMFCGKLRITTTIFYR